MGRTDAELIESATAGDTDAFGELSARHGRRVERFALAATGDQSDAEDVTQETFIEAFKHAARFDGRPEALPWLLGIAANRCRMWGRRRGKADVSLAALPSIPDGAWGDAHTSPESRGLSWELQVDIRRAVHALPIKYRLPVILRFQQGLDYAGIATALKISTGAVAMRLRRAKDLIRRRLDDGHEVDRT